MFQFVLMDFSKYVCMTRVTMLIYVMMWARLRCNAKVLLKDYFVGEHLEIVCIRGENQNTQNQTSWKFKSYGKSPRVLHFQGNNHTQMNVFVRITGTGSILYIPSLTKEHSGQYDCLKTTSSWKVNIHDIERMVFVMTSRGQSQWEDTIVGRYRIGLQWTKWTQCDGCGGNGERKKYGFCYVTWLENKVHCPDTKSVPLMVRALAMKYREEIVVEICYDLCVQNLETVLIDDQRVDVNNGADVTLSCDNKFDAFAVIRWERDGETLKKSDVSFGYEKSKEIYITKKNLLKLHNIHLPQGGIVSVSCVKDRKTRSRFDVNVVPLAEVKTVTFLDHLFWIALSSTLQIVTFLCIMFVYITMENFANLFVPQNKARLSSVNDDYYEM